ncbi:ATP-binding cassette domain-containing protein [Pseudomonas sp. NPDC087346]|uniref:ATP-binding cassette domain-containing protein n=1 Tax=Pseudomonas sp. NPDC087346 TaxID=3364438 RepID=UPI0037F1AE15
MKKFESLTWALRRLAYAQGCVIDPLRLQSSRQIGSTVNAFDYLQLVCTHLGVATPRRLQTPDAARLPLICSLENGEWGVIVDLEPSGDWRVLCDSKETLQTTQELAGRSAQVQCGDRRHSGFEAANDEGASSTGFRSQLNMSLREYRGALIEAGIASAVIGLLALATSLFSMQVYDRVIPTRGEYTLFVLAGGVLLSVLIELAMKLARSHLMDYVVVGFDSRMSREIFQQLLVLRLDQLPASVGSLASQIRGYEQIRSFYTASSLFALIELPMAMLFLGIIMMLATPVVALVMLGFALVALVIGVSARRHVARQAKEGAAYSNMKTGLLVEAVEGAETIKAGSGGWRFLSRWIDVNALSIVSDLKIRHATESTSYLAGTMQQLSYAALIVTGALVVMQGQMSTGALIACSILSGRILNPILALPALLVQHAHARAAEDGLEKLYKLKTDNHGVRRPLVPERIVGRYTVEGLSFAYGEHPAALKVPSLQIQPGERVAVLGPIGSGKSTLLRMLSGLYVPQSGRVLLDGLDLSHISRQVISRQVGYLQQEHRLFQGTLRENLLIGLADPGDEAILHAVRRTGMDRIIASHPQGLDRPITEGGKGLSGGQRQLVAFTRLILCKPSIMLLDEPTASMDEEQERQCLSVLAEEAQGGTMLIIVTHKPSVLPLVNRVLVVVGNNIVADGPRDAVLRQLDSREQPVAKVPPSTEFGVQGEMS